MKHNQWLIERAKEIEIQKKRLKEACDQNVSEIYACICKVLIEKYDWDVERVAQLFEDTSELWNELVEVDGIKDMVDWCEQVTGVELRSKI